MASSLVGRKLGTYQIVELLGQGGMATVYKGYREDIDRYVAIKVLPPHPGLDQNFIDRFKLEAKTIARLQHPHILPLYDYGVEDDILYLVMAYVAGGSLSNRIDAGRLMQAEIETLLRQMAGALDYAHRQGVIHRDIKPDNILLDKEGNALLADFGIVKLSEGGQSRLTVTGGLVGTPAYMSPEQGRGEEVTGSADIYSLGVVIYEMLTGKQPYSADTPMQIVLKHIMDPVPHVRDAAEDLPAALDPVMQRVLAKEPNNRYKTAMEFADDFTRAVHSNESIAGMKLDFQPTPDPTTTSGKVPSTTLQLPATPASAPQPTIIMQQPSTNPLLLLGGFAIIAVLLVVIVLIVVNNNSNSGATTETLATATVVALNPTEAPVVQTEPTGTAVPTFGRLSFSTTDKLGDTVTLQVQNLAPAGSGQVYAAWLRNTQDDSELKLGELTVDALGNGVLPPYIDADGRPLPAFFNSVILTREKSGAETATGEAVYSASLPTEVATALYQIFIASDDGIEVARLSSNLYSAPQGVGGEKAGLLASVLGEADKAKQHAGLAQLATTDFPSVGGMHTHNEHTINISLGTQDDYTGEGRGENPGFGIGIPHFVDLMESQLNAAASAPGSTNALQGALEIIRVCLENTRQRVDQLVELEKQMLAAPDIDDAVKQTAKDSALMGAQLLDGLDSNGNGQVEPYEGECGLQQIQTYGILVSSMNLVESQPAKS